MCTYMHILRLNMKAGHMFSFILSYDNCVIMQTRAHTYTYVIYIYIRMCICRYVCIYRERKERYRNIHTLRSEHCRHA